MKRILICLVLFTTCLSYACLARTHQHTPQETQEGQIIYLECESAEILICERNSGCSEPTEAPTEVPTETPTEAPTETPTEAPTREPDSPTKLTFLATAYSSDDLENGGWGPVDCLYGKPLPEDAIAANLSQLPYGTRVYIDGIGERVVVDTAGEQTLENMDKWVKAHDADGWIDIYCNGDKEWMHEWGVRLVTLTILEWGEGK